MNDPLQIIIALTSLIVAIYMCFKSIKNINTPCFKVTIDGDTKDANLVAYLTHRFTPRAAQQPTSNVVRDIEAATREIEKATNSVPEFLATSSK